MWPLSTCNVAKAPEKLEILISFIEMQMAQVTGALDLDPLGGEFLPLLAFQYLSHFPLESPPQPFHVKLRAIVLAVACASQTAISPRPHSTGPPPLGDLVESPGFR